MSNYPFKVFIAVVVVRGKEKSFALDRLICGIMWYKYTLLRVMNVTDGLHV